MDTLDEPVDIQPPLPQNGHNHQNMGIYSRFDSEEPVAGCKGVELDEKDLRDETHELRMEFNILFTQVLESLDRQKVAVQKFVSFLARCPALTASDKSLFHGVLPYLQKMKNLNSIFDVVADYCSWFNHSLIGAIIRTYCKDDETVNVTYDDFCERLRTYSKHRVCK